MSVSGDGWVCLERDECGRRGMSVSLDAWVCQERNVCVKRRMCVSGDGCVCQEMDVCVRRGMCVSGEGCVCQERDVWQPVSRYVYMTACVIVNNKLTTEFKKKNPQKVSRRMLVITDFYLSIYLNAGHGFYFCFVLVRSCTMHTSNATESCTLFLHTLFSYTVYTLYNTVYTLFLPHCQGTVCGTGTAQCGTLTTQCGTGLIHK